MPIHKKNNYKTIVGETSNSGYNIFGEDSGYNSRNKTDEKELGESVPLEEQTLAEFASVSEDAKQSYIEESFDPEIAMETAEALVKSVNADTHTETETKSATKTETITFNFTRREVELTEEEKMMEALRNGTVYIPAEQTTQTASTAVDTEELKILAEKLKKLDSEIGKTPDTADDSIVIPDIGDENLETDSDVESIHGEFETEDFTATAEMAELAAPAGASNEDLVANSREYRRELDRHNDETLPVVERLSALSQLKEIDRKNTGETPEFTEWMTNFYRGADIASNRRLVQELVKTTPDWLSFDELMILASFLYSGTRARYADLAEWKILVAFYKRLRNGLPQSIPGIHHITITQWLLQHPKLFQPGRMCFTDLLIRNDIRPETIYRLLLNVDMSDSNRYELHKTYFMCKTVPIRFKILSAQNLPSDFTWKFLLKFMQDGETVDVRVRADIADLFLNNGTDKQKDVAKEVIIELGEDSHNVYNNRENVHNTTVTKSALRIIDSLYEHCILDTPPDIFEEGLLNQQILSDLRIRWSSAEEFKIFSQALLRIELDRQTYGSRNLTLVQILNLVIRYINSEFSPEHELHTRIYQELVDSALGGETCSSGHAFRLVNVLGGYTDYNIQISFDDQLSAYFNVEFQRLASAPEYENMMLELISDDNGFVEKPETIAFVRENLHTIRENLWGEFKDVMDDLEFDETFQRVAVKYGALV